MTAAVRNDVVILACAISAGIHAALAPEHFEEGTPAGLGFATAAVLLGALAVVLTVRPASYIGHAAAASVFAGLIVSYAFAITTGVPVLHPDPEPVDTLAIVTKAVEVIGLAAAAVTFRRPRVTLSLRPKGA